MAIIYKITNTSNGKSYIGQHNSEGDGRWLQHQEAAFKRNKDGKLYRSMRKHGAEVWTYEPLMTGITNKPELDYWEHYYVTQYDSCKNGYNCTPDGQGRGSGRAYQPINNDNKKNIRYGLYRIENNMGILKNIFNSREEILSNLESLKINSNSTNHRWVKKGPNDGEFENTLPLKNLPKLPKPGDKTSVFAQYTMDGKLVDIWPYSNRYVESITQFNPGAITKSANGDAYSGDGFIWKKFSNRDEVTDTTFVFNPTNVRGFDLEEYNNKPILKVNPNNNEIINRYDSVDSIPSTSQRKKIEIYFRLVLKNRENDNGGFWVFEEDFNDDNNLNENIRRIINLISKI
jgi:hypothetical protein